MGLECKICMEDVKVEKKLHCNHSFCATCLGKIKRQSIDGKYNIICPFCNKPNILPTNETNLPSKFDDTLVLTCESCADVIPLQKCWWCEKCEETLCGDCTLKKHRSHIDECSDWYQFEPVKSIANCVKNFLARESDKIKQIEKFCENLKIILKIHLTCDVGDANKWLKNVEETFGSDVFDDSRNKSASAVSLASDKPKLIKLEKIFNTVSHVILHQQDGNADVNIKVNLVESLSKNCNKFQCNNDMLKRVVATFLQTTDATSSDSNSGSNKLLWISTSLPTSFSGVCSICSISDNFFILVDDVAIYKLDQSFKEICQKNLPTPENADNEDSASGKCPSSSTSSYPFVAIYAKGGSSVFVTNEVDIENDWGYLFEFDVEDLLLLRVIELPMLESEAEGGYCSQRLISVLEYDKLACVTGDSKGSHVWIMFKDDIDDSKWKHVWKNQNLKPFRAVHQKKENTCDVLFVEAENVIYEFLLTASSTVFRREISIPTVSDNLYKQRFFTMNNNLFHFNLAEEKVAPVCSG